MVEALHAEGSNDSFPARAEMQALRAQMGTKGTSSGAMPKMYFALLGQGPEVMRPRARMPLDASRTRTQADSSASTDPVRVGEHQDLLCACGHSRLEHHGWSKIECLHTDPKTLKFCKCEDFRHAR